MSPSDSESVPPEVLAIAVALALEWQAAEATEQVRAEPPSRWKWEGRQWHRTADHRWS